MSVIVIIFVIFAIYLYSLRRLFKAADRCLYPIIRLGWWLEDRKYLQPMD